MRICIDARVGTPGGTSTFIDNFVRHLADIQHPHIIQFVHSPDNACTVRGDLAARRPFKNRFLELQWSQWGLPALLKHRRFDVYHSLKHVGPLHSPAHTVYRVPAVGQFLGNYPMPMLDHAYWNYLARTVYRRADLLVAVSDYVRRGLIEQLRLPEDRVVTVYSGIDERFHPLEAKLTHDAWPVDIRRPYILCVGNIVPVKNFETAIRAYDLLWTQSRIEPQLVLVGGQRHPHYRELRGLVAGLGLGDRVRFIDYQPRERMVQLYNGARMLIHPSLHEGFSFTILEAMACGTPIVAAATSSIPEAAGAAALYCDEPTSAEQLADRVQELLNSPELSDELARKALRRAAEFTWTRCVRHTVRLYDQLA